MKGVNPAWANLPRRKCDDCGKNYKPKQPLREGQRGFCKDTCRKSYHKHGGAYRKLKTEIGKEITKQIKADATLSTVMELLQNIEGQLLEIWNRIGPRPAVSQAKAVSPLPNPQRRA